MNETAGFAIVKRIFYADMIENPEDFDGLTDGEVIVNKAGLTAQVMLKVLPNGRVALLVPMYVKDLKDWERLPN